MPEVECIDLGLIDYKEAWDLQEKLFQKIKSASPTKVKEERIRVRDSRKVVLIFSSAFRLRFNLF